MVSNQWKDINDFLMISARAGTNWSPVDSVPIISRVNFLTALCRETVEANADFVVINKMFTDE